MQLPTTTVQRWLTISGPCFRPVTIAATSPRAAREPGLVLSTLHGHRLEGLDVATAVAVLCALERVG
jgi:hypothetical protein